MKCESTDLEIETIVNRIKNGDMDLQPDFQRGHHKKNKSLLIQYYVGGKFPQYM